MSGIKRKVLLSKGNNDYIQLYSYPHDNFIMQLPLKELLPQLTSSQRIKLKTLYCKYCTEDDCLDEDYCKSKNDEITLIISQPLSVYKNKLINDSNEDKKLKEKLIKDFFIKKDI